MPFFSPDGQWIGFFTNTQLKKVAVASGAVQNITDNSAEPRGGVWAPDGTIYYAPHNVAPLWKVPASGGTPVEATQLDRARGEISHRWPQVLRRWLTAVFGVDRTRSGRTRDHRSRPRDWRPAYRPECRRHHRDSCRRDISTTDGSTRCSQCRGAISPGGSRRRGADLAAGAAPARERRGSPTTSSRPTAPWPTSPVGRRVIRSERSGSIAPASSSRCSMPGTRLRSGRALARRRNAPFCRSAKARSVCGCTTSPGGR